LKSLNVNYNNFIQVAGIHDLDEARLVINCGVNYLGFPLRLPVNKEDLSEEEAAAIIKSLSPPSYGVLITYLNKSSEIKNLCKELGTRIVQLHGDVALDELIKLKKDAPDISVIKSLIVKRNNIQELIKTVNEISPFVDAFITDTYDTTTGASGATGKTHDWQISRQIVELSPKPVILAGGLTPQNVKDAILFVKPAGVDSHTGVEDSDGRKDEKLVTEFVLKAKSAFKELMIEG